MEIFLPSGSLDFVLLVQNLVFRSMEDKEPNGDRKGHIIIKNKQRHKYVRGQRQALHCASDLWGTLILNKLCGALQPNKQAKPLWTAAELLIPQGVISFSWWC